MHYNISYLHILTNLNELQQPDLNGIFGTNNIYIYILLCHAAMIDNKQRFFQYINIICSLVLSLSIFISLKYQGQTSGGCSRKLSHDFMNSNGNLRPTYGCGGEDGNINISLCMHRVEQMCMRSAGWPLIIYVIRRLRVCV